MLKKKGMPKGDPGELSRLIRGQRKMTFKEVTALASVLHVSRVAIIIAAGGLTEKEVLEHAKRKR